MSDTESESNFNIGDFVKVSRELSVKPNTTDIYESIGVIVRKMKERDNYYKYLFII